MVSRLIQIFRKGLLWKVTVVLIMCIIFQVVLSMLIFQNSRTWQLEEAAVARHIQDISTKDTSTRDTRYAEKTNQVKLPRHPVNLTNDSFAIAHSLMEGININENCVFVVVVTHALNMAASIERLSVFKLEDQISFWLLADFLQRVDDYDAASCIQPPKDKGSTATSRDSGNLNWCRFRRREWSVVIRNTGHWKEMSADNSSSSKYNVQDCNIVEGPFLIRANKFEELGGWRKHFGKASLLDFFFRSKGKLRIAKLKSCVWSKDVTKIDRGPLRGSKDFVEYANLGNEHGVLRIVKEDRIEWTSCIANHIWCPEKPYTSPTALPEVSLPVCCSTVIYNLLEKVVEAFDKSGLQYRLLYGTLLGAVRSKAIIPWTHDADVAIDRSAYDDTSTFPHIQTLLGDDFYIGYSHMNMPRLHPLAPAHITLDTRAFFQGPDDLDGDAFFSPEVQKSVQGMLPILRDWRSRAYLDIYPGFDVWMNDSATVTINSKTFVTVKAIEYELTNWYGKNYLKPALQGSWFGLSDSDSN